MGFAHFFYKMKSPEKNKKPGTNLARLDLRVQSVVFKNSFTNRRPIASRAQFLQLWNRRGCTFRGTSFLAKSFSRKKKAQKKFSRCAASPRPSVVVCIMAARHCAKPALPIVQRRLVKFQAKPRNGFSHPTESKFGTKFEKNRKFQKVLIL